jgi:hypothetical protein
MDTNLLFGAILGLGSLVFGLLIVLLVLRMGTSSELGQRLNDFVDRAGAQPRLSAEENAVRRQELRGSFGSRLLVPGFKTRFRPVDRRKPRDPGPPDRYRRPPLWRVSLRLRPVFILLGFWLAQFAAQRRYHPETGRGHLHHEQLPAQVLLSGRAPARIRSAGLPDALTCSACVGKGWVSTRPRSGSASTAQPHGVELAGWCRR